MIIKRRKRQVPGLNTASTADISFMLLIFFLVTTSMDVDKGLFRLLPSPEPQKTAPQESVVDKSTLMALHVTKDNQLLLNDKPTNVAHLKGEIVRFVHRLGNRHLISIESDRDADYDLYFQMQNQIMMAYNEIKDEYAQKHFGKVFSALTTAEKEKVRKACPQRITESYANATVQEDKSIDASAEEQKQDEKQQKLSESQQKQPMQKGGKQS